MFLWVQRKEQYKFRRDEEEMMWRTGTLKHWWRLLLECGAWTRGGMRSCVWNLYFSSIYCLTVAHFYNIFWSISALHSFLFSYHHPIPLLSVFIVLTLCLLSLARPWVWNMGDSPVTTSLKTTASFLSVPHSVIRPLNSIPTVAL